MPVMTTITAPPALTPQAIDGWAIAPIVALAVGAVVVLLVDLAVPRRWLVAAASPELSGSPGTPGEPVSDPPVGSRTATLARLLPGTFAVLSLLTSAVLMFQAGRFLPDPLFTLCQPNPTTVLPSCAFAVDRFTIPMWGVIVFAALVVSLLSITPSTLAKYAYGGGEYFALLLASTAGALTLAASRDLLTLLIALELVTLPLVALTALRRTAPGAEGAVKLFLVSTASLSVSVLGAGLVYAGTGAVQLDAIATALPSVTGWQFRGLVAIGMILLLAGFGVKIAAVPFHAWAPETYVGAPVPVTAYLAVVSKTAGFAGVLLVLTLAFAPLATTWAPVLAVVAAVTMTVGNVVALRQRQAVRLLAWSSIAHSGFILAPLAAGAMDLPGARRATLVYLLSYAVMTLAAFTAVILVGRWRPDLRLSDFRGLARTEPLTAAVLVFALACLAGMPPGLLGLFAKMAVFGPPITGGKTWLTIVMAINVVIALAYYLPWAATVWARGEKGSAPPSFKLSAPDGLAIGITLSAAIVLSVLPVFLFRAVG